MVNPGNFVKLYASILDSSIWSESHATVRVWITMLAMANANGHVVASYSGLAHRANVTREELTAALAVLEAPDPDSKNPDHEGRRVERVEGGWFILNHRAYRELRTDTRESQEQIERRADRAANAYVYYARNNGAVKIGCSLNPWSRVNDLKTAAPAVRLVAKERGGPELEKARHAQFAAARIDREWFRETPELTALIESLQTGHRSDSVEAVADYGSATVATGVALRNTEGEVEVEREVDQLQDQKLSSAAPTASAPVPATGDAALTAPALKGYSHGREGTSPEPSRAAGAPPASTPAMAMIRQEQAREQRVAARERPRKSALVGKRAEAVIGALQQVLNDVAAGTAERRSRDEQRQLLAGLVFGYWAKVLHHEGALLDQKRERVLVQRLKENGDNLDELLYVIDGASHDDWTMGRDPKSTGRYDSINQLFGSRERVEKFAGMVPGYRAGRPHGLTKKYLAVVAQELEQEIQTAAVEVPASYGGASGTETPTEGR